MFPNPQDAPSGCGEAFVGIEIAPLVRLNLVSPEIGIALGARAMLWATVPKAAVDEDRNAMAREGDIWPRCAPPSANPKIHAVPEPSSVQQGSDCELRLRVTALRGTHGRGSRCHGRIVMRAAPLTDIRMLAKW